MMCQRNKTLWYITSNVDCFKHFTVIEMKQFKVIWQLSWNNQQLAGAIFLRTYSLFHLLKIELMSCLQMFIAIVNCKTII